MTFPKIAIITIFFLLLIATLGAHPWFFLMLTVAQLVYVPMTLHMIMQKDEGWIPIYYPYLGIPAFIAIVLLQMSNETVWDPFLSLVYFSFTLLVAWYGIMRFFKRGFTNFEECVIDIGLIYLAVGGAWFVAYEAKIDTGFSPIMTWLTAIHFHYSAFLLPVFVGFLGRVIQSRAYKWIGSLIVLSPIIVALGITFSTTLELVSVIIYIIAIYSLILISLKTAFQHLLQKRLIMLSFAALGLSIIFSLLYALGNMSGYYVVTIDYMLRSHGILNAVLFALVGMMGWLIQTPSSKARKLSFPVSRIRGKGVIDESSLAGYLDDRKNFGYKGLVDNLNIYEPDINTSTLSPTIIDFYEQTQQYRLFAEVKWRFWFKPLAWIYRLLSSYTKQINLPLSSQRVEMTGSIIPIKDEIDGRCAVRAWVRKINGEITFVALYSSHQEQGRRYMNIALPLPYSTMIGILELSQSGSHLRITSKREQREDADSGIYLAISNYLFKLPLEEDFHVQEIEQGILHAEHRMWIFALPFLTINYFIYHQDLQNMKC